MKSARVAIVLSILALFVSSGSLYIILTTEPQKEIVFRKTYDISSKLKVTYQNDTVIFYEIDRLIVLSYANRQVYNFSSDDMIITNGSPDYKLVQIYFFIPENAYQEFSKITAKWAVEDKFGVFQKDSFILENQGIPFYITSADLTNIYWKEQPPNEIETTISLEI